MAFSEKTKKFITKYLWWCWYVNYYPEEIPYKSKENEENKDKIS
jgi:hypothetical protein